MKIEDIESNDPRDHARRIQQTLGNLVDQLRDDIDRVNDPKARVLFETAAEVLIGLRTAFEHYESGGESAMR